MLGVMKILSLLVPFVLACAGPANPSDGEDLSAHHDGFDRLCHAEARSKAIGEFPFAAKMQTINTWLAAELDDDYVNVLYAEKLPQEPLQRQGDILRRRALAAGVQHCPMAGLIDFLNQLSNVTNALDDCEQACVARHAEQSVDDLQASCSRGCGG